MSESNSIIKTSLPYKDPLKAIFNGPDWEIIGQSVKGNPISGKHLEGKGNKVLLIGGVHGNETEGVSFMEAFVREFVIDESKSPFSNDLFVVPVFNPDGFLSFQRGNANGVDLNRNLPTKDWTGIYSEERYFPGNEAASEPETLAMMELLEKYEPDFIISFHSWKPMININGPARTFAEAMQKKMDMEIVEDIGYPTPGSLGTFAGWERNIPTITLEFERGLALDSIYSIARDAVIDAISI